MGWVAAPVRVGGSEAWGRGKVVWGGRVAVIVGVVGLGRRDTRRLPDTPLREP